MILGTAALVLAIPSVGGAGCATTRGTAGLEGPRYQISVRAVDGYPASSRGILGREAGVLQIGDQVVRFWAGTAGEGRDPQLPVIEVDEASLREGLSLDTDPWGSAPETARVQPEGHPSSHARFAERLRMDAVLHRITDDELSRGSARVEVPRPSWSPLGGPVVTVIDLDILRIAKAGQAVRQPGAP
jgi:hypothetical protein